MLLSSFSRDNQHGKRVYGPGLRVVQAVARTTLSDTKFVCYLLPWLVGRAAVAGTEDRISGEDWAFEGRKKFNEWDRKFIHGSRWLEFGTNVTTALKNSNCIYFSQLYS